LQDRACEHDCHTLSVFLVEIDSAANAIIPTKQTRITLRVDAGLLAELDMLAEGRGGRSAYLRTLVLKAVEAEADVPKIDPVHEKSVKRVAPGFSEAELAVIAFQAAKSSTDPSNWIRQLVRRWCGLKGHVERPLMERLLSVRQELRRIGRNVNQIARAANKLALDADSQTGGRALGAELEKLHALRGDVMTQFDVLDGAMRADMDYWKVAD